MDSQIQESTIVNISECDHTVVDFIQQEIKKRNVVIFSKTDCLFSKKAKAVFHDCDYIYYAVELDLRRDGSKIQDALEKITGNGHTPFVFFKGDYFGGGCKDFLEIHEMDRLRILLDVPPRPIYPLNSVYARTKEYLKKKYSVNDLSNPTPHLVTQTRTHCEPLDREDAAIFTTHPDMPDHASNLLRHFFREKDRYGHALNRVPPD